MSVIGESHFTNVGKNRRIHFCDSGSGPVTVMFEAGLGRSRHAWAAVAPAVAEFARVVTYDRAGTGRSDAQSGPRAIEDMISDHLAVRAAAVDGPCVVVGHSYGGAIARGAAVVEPLDVRGLVLVDEVSELCDRIVYGTGMLGSGAVYRARVGLARLGVLRRIVARPHERALLADDAPAAPGTRLVTEQLLAEVRTEDGNVRAARAALREWQGFTASLRRFADSGPWVPEVPLTTISANRLPPEKRDADYIARSHQDLVDLAKHGQHVFAQTNSHNIHLVEPAAVVDEIRAQVADVGDTVVVRHPHRDPKSS